MIATRQLALDLDGLVNQNTLLQQYSRSKGGLEAKVWCLPSFLQHAGMSALREARQVMLHPFIATPTIPLFGMLEPLLHYNMPSMTT
jgi:hypothetical protein